VKPRIRPALPQDYQALCQLLEDVDALHQDHLPDRFRQAPGPVRDRAYIFDLIEDENTALLVAEIEGLVTGMVHLTIVDVPPIPILVPRQVAIIENLVVGEGFRWAGTGRALMAAAQVWARRKGADSLELTVYEFNRAARTFYEKMGYETMSRRMSKALTR